MLLATEETIPTSSSVQRISLHMCWFRRVSLKRLRNAAEEMNMLGFELTIAREVVQTGRLPEIRLIQTKDDDAGVVNIFDNQNRY